MARLEGDTAIAYMVSKAAVNRLTLASDEAKYITGALLPVDGGFTTRVGNADA